VLINNLTSLQFFYPYKNEVNVLILINLYYLSLLLCPVIIQTHLKIMAIQPSANWICALCTYENEENTSACLMCATVPSGKLKTLRPSARCKVQTSQDLPQKKASSLIGRDSTKRKRVDCFIFSSQR
jgi:hypothetical protein